jgi:hypothetical protein
VAEVKALACELPATHGLPLGRFTRTELHRLVIERGLSDASASTIWRWLHDDALKPWQQRSWVFPRDRCFAAPPPPSSPDFSLSASPSTQSVIRGAATSYTVAVTPMNGFTDPVTLSVAGLPTGATASFSSNPTPTTSTLTIYTTATTKTGTFALSITGTAGTLTHTTTVTLQIRRK